MEIRQLKTFQKVAALLSFSLAADELHYAQSTVSAQIKALEQDLGVSLFDRMGSKISLTQAGENLLAHSKRLLAVAEETYSAVNGEKMLEGSLTVRVPQTIANHYLPPLLETFCKVHPKVQLQFNNCSAYRLLDELSSSAIDVAFLLTESVLSDRLNAELLGIEELVLITPPDHPLASRNEVDLAQLQGQSLLLPTTDCDYPLWLKKSLLEQRIKPAAIQNFNSVESIKQCVMKGLGLAMLPRCAVEAEAQEGKLALLPWAEGALETGVFMIWHKKKWLPPALSAFIESTRQNKVQYASVAAD